MSEPERDIENAIAESLARALRGTDTLPMCDADLSRDAVGPRQCLTHQRALLLCRDERRLLVPDDAVAVTVEALAQAIEKERLWDDEVHGPDCGCAREAERLFATLRAKR